MNYANAGHQYRSLNDELKSPKYFKQEVAVEKPFHDVSDSIYELISDKIEGEEINSIKQHFFSHRNPC